MPKINLGYIILASLLVFGVLYLLAVNNISTKGYEIRSLEKRAQELSDSAKRLELEAAELRSIQSIESGVKTLNLVPSAGVDYVKDEGYALNR